MSDYTCNLCGGPGALPTMTCNDDPPGFTLYEQPALCAACDTKWSEATREYRARVRRHLGVEDEAEVKA